MSNADLVKPRGIAGTLLLCLMMCSAASTSTTAAVDQTWETSSDAIMIVIDDPRSVRQKRGISGPGYSPRLAYADDPLLHRTTGKIASDYGLTVLEQWPLKNLSVHCFVVERPSSDTIEALIDDPRIRWVQPFNEFSTQSGNAKTGSYAGVFKRFSDDFEQRGKGIQIAVIDTSVDQSHPDLFNSHVSEANFAGTRGLIGEEEHGTAVVGLISAMASSPKGISGIASEAKVRVLRACWQALGAAGKCNTLTLALALDAAIDLEPNILNLSLTGPFDRVLQELLDVLLNNGTLVVAAYDDNRAPEARFPAPKSGIIYAYGADVSISPSADRNVLGAPNQALTLALSAGYELVSGHSIAAPHITAMAACLMSHHRGASRPEIQAQLTGWLEPTSNMPSYESVINSAQEPLRSIAVESF